MVRYLWQFYFLFFFIWRIYGLTKWYFFAIWRKLIQTKIKQFTVYINGIKLNPGRELKPSCQINTINRLPLCYSILNVRLYLLCRDGIRESDVMTKQFVVDDIGQIQNDSTTDYYTTDDYTSFFETSDLDTDATLRTSTSASTSKSKQKKKSMRVSK